MNDICREIMLKELGLELDQAFVTCAPIDPISERGLGLTLSDAYKIQGYMLAPRLERGSRTWGRKIGCTSEPVQKAVLIDEPDFGLLLDDCAYSSGDLVSCRRLIQPRAEGEIAFFLRERLEGPGVTAEEVLSATDYVSPCIEIVDSRIRDWRITIIDTVADNASCGLFVLGRDRGDPAKLDLAACRMTMSVNGIEATQGTGAATLGHPAGAVAWLANKLAAFGEALEPGEPILSGSLGSLVEVRPGDELRLDLQGMEPCSARFRL